MQDGQCVQSCQDGWYLPTGTEGKNGTCQREPTMHLRSRSSCQAAMHHVRPVSAPRLTAPVRRQHLCSPTHRPAPSSPHAPTRHSPPTAPASHARPHAPAAPPHSHPPPAPPVHPTLPCCSKTGVSHTVHPTCSGTPPARHALPAIAHALHAPKPAKQNVRLARTAPLCRAASASLLLATLGVSPLAPASACRASSKVMMDLYGAYSVSRRGWLCLVRWAGGSGASDGGHARPRGHLRGITSWSVLKMAFWLYVSRRCLGLGGGEILLQQLRDNRVAKRRDHSTGTRGLLEVQNRVDHKASVNDRELKNDGAQSCPSSEPETVPQRHTLTSIPALTTTPISLVDSQRSTWARWKTGRGNRPQD